MALASDFTRQDVVLKRRGDNGRMPNPKSSVREIVGHHGHKPHGPSILWPSLYEHLRKKGYTKEKAARISNSAWNKKHAGMKTNTPTSARGLLKSEHVAAISKVDAEKRTVFGWAYVTHDEAGELVVDKSGEFIDDVDELEDMAYGFVLKSRRGDSDHDMVVKSTLVESMVFTPEKIEALGLFPGDLPVGWWTGWKIHDDDAWEGVKKKKYGAFSIYGKSLKKDVEDDD